MGISLSSCLTSLLVAQLNSEGREANWSLEGKEAPLHNRIFLTMGATALLVVSVVESIAYIAFSLATFALIREVSDCFVSSITTFRWNLSLVTTDPALQHRGSFLTNEDFVRLAFCQHRFADLPFSREDLEEVDHHDVVGLYQQVLQLDRKVFMSPISQSLLQRVSVAIREDHSPQRLKDVARAARNIQILHALEFTPAAQVPRQARKEANHFYHDYIRGSLTSSQRLDLQSRSQLQTDSLFFCARMAYLFVHGVHARAAIPSFISTTENQIPDFIINYCLDRGLDELSMCRMQIDRDSFCGKSPQEMVDVVERGFRQKSIPFTESDKVALMQDIGRIKGGKESLQELRHRYAGRDVAMPQHEAVEEIFSYPPLFRLLSYWDVAPIYPERAAPASGPQTGATAEGDPAPALTSPQEKARRSRARAMAKLQEQQRATLRRLGAQEDEREDSPPINAGANQIDALKDFIAQLQRIRKLPIHAKDRTIPHLDRILTCLGLSDGSDLARDERLNRIRAFFDRLPIRAKNSDVTSHWSRSIQQDILGILQERYDLPAERAAPTEALLRVKDFTRFAGIEIADRRPIKFLGSCCSARMP